MPRTADLRRFLGVWRPYLLSAAIAAALVLASANVPGRAGARAVEIWWLFGAGMVVGLLVQHRWPLAAVALTVIGATAHQLEPSIGLKPLDLAVPISAYVLATSARPRWLSVVALAIILVDSYAVHLVTLIGANHLNVGTKAPELAKSAGDLAATKPPPVPKPLSGLLVGAFGEGFAGMAVVALAVAVGDGIRTRRAHLRTIEQRAADLEREQHQRIALATAAERARITASCMTWSRTA